MENAEHPGKEPPTEPLPRWNDAPRSAIVLMIAAMLMLTPDAQRGHRERPAVAEP